MTDSGENINYRFNYYVDKLIYGYEKAVGQKSIQMSISEMASIQLIASNLVVAETIEKLRQNLNG